MAEYAVYMIRPKKKLKRMMILDGMDFGSTEEPCSSQEPQMTIRELPEVKDSGYFSQPKRYESLRTADTMARKDPRTTQRLAEKG